MDYCGWLVLQQYDTDKLYRYLKHNTLINIKHVYDAINLTKILIEFSKR